MSNKSSKKTVGKKGKKQVKASISKLALIKKAVNTHLKKCDTMPTITYISNETGVSRATIGKYLNDLTLTPAVAKYKVFTDDVTMAVIHSAKSGNVHAMRLFYQLVYRWKEPTHAEIPEEQDREINIVIQKRDEKKTVIESNVNTQLASSMSVH